MKSIEVKFNEAMEAVKKAGKAKKFEENKKGCTTIEQKLNTAEAVLKDAGIVRESRPVKKNNGAGDNFTENNPLRPVEEFRESSNDFAPGYVKEVKDPCAKGDEENFIRRLLSKLERSPSLSIARSPVRSRKVMTSSASNSAKSLTLRVRLVSVRPIVLRWQRWQAPRSKNLADKSSRKSTAGDGGKTRPPSVLLVTTFLQAKDQPLCQNTITRHSPSSMNLRRTQS